MRRIMVPLAAAVLLAGSVGVVRHRSRAAEEQPARIDLDPAVRFQTIDGWAVYPRYWEANKNEDRFDGSFERVVGPVSRFVVDSIGVNAVRLEVWSGMENPVSRWASFRA